MAKSKRGKSGSSTEMSRWELELTQAPINEECWKSMTIFITPNHVDDVAKINVMTETVLTGLRKLISIIEHDHLMQEVKDLGSHGKGGKGKVVGKPPQFIEICDQAKAILDQGEKLSPAMTAKIIKFKMLLLKQKDIDRRAEEKKAAEAAAKQAQKGDDRGRSRMASAKRTKSQSPTKKKGKKDDRPPSPKKDTKLKRRGEVEDTFKTIDDEPDGPNDPHHYFLIAGFHDPKVLNKLTEIGVLLDANFMVKAQSYEKEIINDVPAEEGDAEEEAVKDTSEITEKEALTEKIDTYKTQVDDVINNLISGHPLKEMATIPVVLPEKLIASVDVSSLEGDDRADFGTKVFDEIAQACYKLIDHKVHHGRYLECLELVNIPDISTSATLTEPGSQAVVSMEVDMRYYNQLMDQVPAEKQSPQILLHGLLEQVSVTVDGDKNTDNEVEHVQSPSSILDSYIDEKLARFSLKSGPQESSLKHKQDNAPSKAPTVLFHLDSVGERLFDRDLSKDVDSLTMERGMYKLHPLNQLSAALNQEEEDRVTIIARNQQVTKLWQQKSQLDAPDIFWRGLQHLVLEALPIQMVDEYGDIIEPDLNNNPTLDSLDDPFHGPTEDTSPLAFDTNNFVRNLNGWNVIEPHQPDTMIQVLANAVATHPFIDSYFHKATSSLLIVLHNPSGENLQNKLGWDTWVHSNVGFRNYMEHITEYIDDWQRECDQAEEEKQAQSITPNIPEPEPSPVPLKPENRGQMLTRQEIIEMKAAEEEKGKKKGKKSPRSGNKLRPGSKRSDTRTSSARSSKSRAQSGKKKAGTGKGKPENADEENKDNLGSKEGEEKVYQFQGYDIGDRLIHISGVESYLFPEDGGIVRIDKSDFIQGNKTVRTCLFKNGNILSVHFLNPVKEVEPANQDVVAVETVQRDASTPDILLQSSEDSKQKLEVGASSHHSSNINPTTLELPALPFVPKPISKYSSFVVQYKDGFILSMCASVSEELHHKYEHIAETLDLIESGAIDDKIVQNSLTTATSTQQVKTGSPKGRKKHDDEQKKQEELERLKEQERRRLVLEVRTEIEELKGAIHQLRNCNITCPDGLHITVAVVGDHADEQKGVRRVIRQCYPGIKGNSHECEKVRATVAVNEKVRCVNQDGQVIKIMKDDSVEVFCPDGTIIRARAVTPPPPTNTVEEKTQAETKEDGAIDRVPSKRISRTPLVVKETSFESNVKLECTNTCFKWEIVESDGTKTFVDEEGKRESAGSLLSSIATCPKTHQTLETREDGLSIVRRVDGTEIIEHVDGTRLTVQQGTRQCQDEETGEKESHEDLLPSTLVKVECLGYATVMVNVDDGLMQVLFGEGSLVKSFKEGSYTIQRSDDGDIFIDHEGTCLYTHETNVTFDGKTVLNEDNLPSDSYLLRHSSPTCLSTIDRRGNSFVCSSDGTVNISKAQNSEGEVSSIPHRPRFFILYADGSGEEVLHKDDIDSYLERVEKDSNSAILSSGISNYPEAKGITVLQPFKGTAGERWLKPKDENEIIPVGLRERDFHTFPSKKDRMLGLPPRKGPLFSSLSPRIAKEARPVIACPPVLELRHLIQQPPLTDDVKKMIFEVLSEYRELVKNQNRFEEGLYPADPRSEEEINASRDLLRKAKEALRKDNNEASHENNALNIANAYVEAIAPPPSPPPVKAEPKRPAAAWERDKIEVAEMNYAKDSLRRGVVPPYFDTEEGQAFLNRKKKPIQDLTTLTANLAKQTIRPKERPLSVESVTSETNENLSNLQFESTDNSSGTQNTSFLSTFDDSLMALSSNSSGLSPKPRPLNPTPNKGSVFYSENEMASPSTMDPSIPVVAQSGVQPMLARVPEEPKEAFSKNNGNTGPVTTGGTDRVPVPRSVLGSRPGALPNNQFMQIEDPVRRTIKTASVAGSVNPDSTARLRGFILVPDFVDFGVLKEGCSYVYNVELKNVGVDMCRFKIKQPPPSTGLKVNYKPGPVAAGMSVTFELELFAVAVGVEGPSGVGSIAHHVEIVTETDALYLPVVATILTAYEFENPSPSCPDTGPTPETVQMKQRPSSRESLTRPRKFEST